jgi:UDP-N-acetyl-D-mannosaminuronate dehydrogenase
LFKLLSFSLSIVQLDIMKLKINSSLKIGIVGLGYVGLPLALAFSEYFEVYAFDKDEQRIDELKKGVDTTQQSGDLLEVLSKKRASFFALFY